MSDRDAEVTIRPARKSGAPCVRGVPVYLIVETVWHHGVDEAEASFDMERAPILTACWFVAAYNLDHLGSPGDRFEITGKRWRSRWGQWALDVHHAMWSSEWDDITDPPTKDTP